MNAVLHLQDHLHRFHPSISAPALPAGRRRNLRSRCNWLANHPTPRLPAFSTPASVKDELFAIVFISIQFLPNEYL